MVRIAQDHGAPSRLIEAVVAVNDARKASMAARIVAAAGGSVRGRTIAVLGLTFKPETDDMRDAPSVPIVGRLVEDGATVRAFDPEGMEQAKPVAAIRGDLLPRRAGCGAGRGFLVVITEWNEFRAIEPQRLREAMRGNLVVDLRNLYEPAAMRAAGFTYSSIGRP
jgi:UDPglucose 6-dehydrogenase